MSVSEQFINRPKKFSTPTNDAKFDSNKKLREITPNKVTTAKTSPHYNSICSAQKTVETTLKLISSFYIQNKNDLKSISNSINAFTQAAQKFQNVIHKNPITLGPNHFIMHVPGLADPTITVISLSFCETELIINLNPLWWDIQNDFTPKARNQEIYFSHFFDSLNPTATLKGLSKKLATVIINKVTDYKKKHSDQVGSFTVSISGHSLGGLLARMVKLYFENNPQHKIVINPAYAISSPIKGASLANKLEPLILALQIIPKLWSSNLKLFKVLSNLTSKGSITTSSQNDGKAKTFCAIYHKDKIVDVNNSTDPKATNLIFPIPSKATNSITKQPLFSSLINSILNFLNLTKPISMFATHYTILSNPILSIHILLTYLSQDPEAKIPVAVLSAAKEFINETNQIFKLQSKL